MENTVCGIPLILLCQVQYNVIVYGDYSLCHVFVSVIAVVGCSSGRAVSRLPQITHLDYSDRVSSSQ